jgi:hypothetical protein
MNLVLKYRVKAYSMARRMSGLWVLIVVRSWWLIAGKESSRLNSFCFKKE